MSFILISHANADKPKLKHVVDALIARGHKVWIDDPLALGYTLDDVSRSFYRLHAGDQWRRPGINRALREAIAVVVCWSERAREDRLVWHSEATYARVEEKLVACIIDDVDPQSLPDEFSSEQTPDLRATLPDPHSAASRWASGKRLPNPFLAQRLDQFVRDVERKIVDVKRRRLGSSDRRAFDGADRFVPFFVDRHDQEQEILEALIAARELGHGVAPFCLSGPDNECLDEFYARLEHKSAGNHVGNGKAWQRITVPWPSTQGPERFAMAYGRSLRMALAELIGQAPGLQEYWTAWALSLFGRPIAVTTSLNASTWDKRHEAQRIRAWCSFWRGLEAQPYRFTAIPILLLKMAPAPAGWTTYPPSSTVDQAVKNADIVTELRSLVDGRRSMFDRLLGRKPPAPAQMGLPPLLQPISKAHVDDWLGMPWFTSRPDAKAAAEEIRNQIFEAPQPRRFGVPMREFADAMLGKKND